MSYRSLALAVTALTSMHATSAISGEAPSVYVAPGGVYIGAGPVYVVPAPNGNGHYVAPTYGYGYEYGPPVPPPPAVVAPTTVYGPNGRYYSPPLSVYGAELPPPRPPAAVPYYGNGYGNGHVRGYRYGYDPRWQTPY